MFPSEEESAVGWCPCPRNKQRTQALLNEQDTLKMGPQRILYVVLDSTRHRPKAKSFRLLQHSIIDNILNFTTSVFSFLSPCRLMAFIFFSPKLVRLQVLQTSAAMLGRLLTDQKELLCLWNGAINLSAFSLRNNGSYPQGVQNRRPHTAIIVCSLLPSDTAQTTDHNLIIRRKLIVNS